MSAWVSWSALGTRLREARLNAHLTQREIGRAIGISQPQYSCFERGSLRPTRDRLAQIAVVLKLDLAELLMLTGDEQRGTSTRMQHHDPR